MSIAQPRNFNRSNIMMTLSILPATALGLSALFVSSAHAGPAPTYAWCSPRDGDGNSDCMYSTYQQCVAAASGLGGGGCSPNPQFNLPRRSYAKEKY
jgi:hypothetical protein